MAENLNYKTPGGSWCYKNDNSNCDKYGRLYDWKTAKTVCPKGFHLPSLDEWGAVVAAAGGKDAAGKMLKSASGWDGGGNGADAYGFSAAPGGLRFTNGSFDNAGKYGFWWTVTESAGAGGNAYIRGMDYDEDYAGESSFDKNMGLSVRCAAD